MATPLEKIFLNNKKTVSQCDDESTAETMVIYFDQEKFEQFLFGGSTNPLHVRKHMKITLAKTSLAKAWKQISFETSKALCKPTVASGEANRLCLSLA